MDTITTEKGHPVRKGYYCEICDKVYFTGKLSKTKEERKHKEQHKIRQDDSTFNIYKEQIKESEEETKAYLQEEANQNISDILAKQRNKGKRFNL